MNKKIILPVLAILGIVGAGFAYTTLYSTPVEVSTPMGTPMGVLHGGSFEAHIIKADGTIIPLGGSHNLFTDEGKKFVASVLNGSETNGIDAIQIGNGSNVTESDASLDGVITECGLEENAVTFFTGGVGTGNLTGSTIFTNTCAATIKVNTTAIECNSCAAGSNHFAAANFTSDANLAQNDQLNVSWFVWSV